MLDKEFIRASFQRGEVTLIAGYPPTVRTSFAETLTFSLAIQGRNPSYFSFGKNGQRLINRVCRPMNGDIKLLVNDTQDLKVKVIRNEIESSHVDFVVINQLQDICCEQMLFSRKLELKNILQGLKELAEEFKIPVVVMAQLRRRRFVRSNLSDVRNEICECLTPFNIAMVQRPENYGIIDTFSNGKKVHGKIEYIKYNGNDTITTYLYLDKYTKEISMWLTRQRLKDEIANTDKWMINLDVDDLKEIDDGDENNVIVFEASTGDTTEERFHKLIGSIRQVLESSKAMEQEEPRMLMLIQLPLSAPAKMSEMNLIYDFLNELIPLEKDCLIKWGISLRESNTSRIIGEVRK